MKKPPDDARRTHIDHFSLAHNKLENNILSVICEIPKVKPQFVLSIEAQLLINIYTLETLFSRGEERKKNVENGNWFQIHWELCEYVYKHINGLKCAFISNRSNVLLAEISIYMSCVHVRLCVCVWSDAALPSPLPPI